MYMGLLFLAGRVNPELKKYTSFILFCEGVNYYFTIDQQYNFQKEESKRGETLAVRLLTICILLGIQHREG